MWVRGLILGSGLSEESLRSAESSVPSRDFRLTYNLFLVCAEKIELIEIVRQKTSDFKRIQSELKT